MTDGFRNAVWVVALVVAGCSGSGTSTGGGSGASGGGSVSAGGGTGGSAGGGAAGGGAAGGGTGGATGGGTGGGATGGGTGGDAGTGLALKSFCDQYAAAACALRFACGRYESASSALCLKRESQAVLCAQADAGSVAYDGVLAQRCLAEISDMPTACYGAFPACGQLLRNTDAPGLGAVFTAKPNACGAAACNGSTACDFDCTGPTCKPFRALGQPCSDSQRPYAQCDPATGWCGTTDGGARTCLPLVALNGDCTAQPCGPGLVCELSGATQRCAALLPAEAPCQFVGQCASGVCRGSDNKCGARDAGAACTSPNDCGSFLATSAVCVGLTLSADGGPATPGVCGPRPALGQPCSYAWATSTDPCRTELAEGCIDGVCRTLTPFSYDAGAECPIRAYGRVEAPYYGFAICKRGLTCQPSPTAHPPKTGRCAPALGVGGSCRDEFWCAAGLGCLPEGDGGSVCAPIPLRGELCPRGSCRADSTCAPEDGGSRCRALGTIDAGCTGFGSCEEGTTCNGTVCVASGTAGSACQYDFECVSGACQNDVCVAMCIR